jgi:phage gp46-like protein
MPGLDRRIDPETGDWIDDGAGGFEETDTCESAAYLQIRIHRGEYWADGSAGSDVHLVPRMSLTQALEFAPETLRAALQRLVDAGLAKDLFVEVTADPDHPHRLTGVTEITDAQGGRVDLSQIAGLQP